MEREEREKQGWNRRATQPYSVQRNSQENKCGCAHNETNNDGKNHPHYSDEKSNCANHNFSPFL